MIDWGPPRGRPSRTGSRGLSKREFRGARLGGHDLSRRWDAAAAASDHFRSTAPRITDAHYRRVVRQLLARWFPDVRGWRVLKLDLYNEATGTAHTGYFTEGGATLVGIDISWRIARQAADRDRPPVGIVTGDVRQLPFADGSFDAIFSLGTLEHVQEADQPAVAAELFRVMRPGGRCLIGVNNRYSLWLTPILFELLELTGLVRESWSYEPTYPPGHLRRLLEGAGFVECHADGTLLFPKWLRVYDMWSASRSGGFFAAANRAKNAVLPAPGLGRRAARRLGKTQLLRRSDDHDGEEELRIANCELRILNSQ